MPGHTLPGAVQFANAASLSFTGDGRALVVPEARCHRGPSRTCCGGRVDMQVRALSPDGWALTAALARCPQLGACTLSVARISADTGRRLRVLYQVRTADHYHGYFERFFSSDPSGRYLILDAGVGSARVNG